MTVTTFPQVSAKCGSVKPAPGKDPLYSGAFRRDLQKYAAEAQAKPSATRLRRHRLESAIEKRGKLIAETGFDLAGIMCEPPAEQWERPQAQTLYHKLMIRDPGKPNTRDYEGEDLRHLVWMIEAELTDIDPDGTIWLLSDAEPPSRKYPGAPVGDDRARIGSTHSAEVVQALVREVQQAIFDGHPVYDIPAEFRAEMNAKQGIRLSARLIASHINRLLASRLDAACNCLGRDQVARSWDLRDHGENCPGRSRWLHIDVVQRAIREMVISGELHRTSGSLVTRRGHTEYRIPCAYEIPADAGWHAYAAAAPRRRHRAWSPLRQRLLGGDRAPAEAVDRSWQDGGRLAA